MRDVFSLVPSPLRRLLGKALARRLDLTRLHSVPKRLRMPLLRNGVDPVPELGQTRERAPVHNFGNLLGINIWLVTGHAEAKAVLADRSSYRNNVRHLVAGGDTATADGIGGLGFTDPPDHTRLRKLLTPEFTRRRLARLEPAIDDIVERRLDELESSGPDCDLVSAFSVPIPFQVICELLGLPLEERARFQALGPARFDVSEGAAGVFGAASKSREFLFEMVARQRENPGDGLIGTLIKEHGDELDDVELGGLADGTFLGGYETSASMLSLGTLVLLQNPEAYAMARDPEAIDGIVSELLRYLSVVQVAFPRFARHDHDLFGHAVSAGDVVLCSLSGADRDPVFGAGADRFDPHRPAGPHLAFGHGLHRCVGAELARMELRAAFSSLSRRFPDLSLAVAPEELNFRKLSIVYGVEALPVRLHPPAAMSGTSTSANPSCQTVLES
ncbi:MAG: cytochrome P450 [Nocardioidaceae bacterium]